MSKNVIEIKNLTKYYGKQKGIEDVSFNVEEGEIFGFIGPNGAGKSTTIRTLLKLINKTSGTASIFGKDVSTTDISILLKDVGYLPSEVFYYDGMKAIDLLKYSESFYKKDCTKKIQNLAKALELDLNRKIEDLSYGNKKKVGIIQGLLHEPRLIILDEPTGGLDPLMQQRFFEILEEENRKGATILFSSHILSEVQKMCSRVAIIKDGQIIKMQKISELKNDNYKRFHIVTKDSVLPNYFEEEEVTNISIVGNKVSFLFRGDINYIIDKINKIPLIDLVIDEPSLEEIFLHYYE